MGTSGGNTLGLVPTRVLIVGMMGAGKTTIGKALADRTGWPYLDNDEILKRLTGHTAKELLSEGVAALRGSESAAVVAALQLDPPLVAGIPGGAIEDAASRYKLRDNGFVVWLRAAPKTLLSRLAHDFERPWLQPDAEAALRRLYAGREPHYAEIADLVLDVDDKPPDELVNTIVAALPRRGD